MAILWIMRLFVLALLVHAISRGDSFGAGWLSAFLFFMVFIL
jgi:hypothetical protein